METLSVTDDGITVPDKFQDESSIVIRTPQNTVDISSGFSSMLQDGKFPLVVPRDFGDTDDYQNPHLAPDSVSFKKYSAPEVEYTVNY